MKKRKTTMLKDLSVTVSASKFCICSFNLRKLKLLLFKTKTFCRYILKYPNIIRGKAQAFSTKDFLKENSFTEFTCQLRDQKVLRGKKIPRKYFVFWEGKKKIYFDHSTNLN